MCTKVDEGNVYDDIRITAGDAMVGDFSVDNYAALTLKHPQKDTCFVSDPTDIDCLSAQEFFGHEALMSFPNNSSASLDSISPHVLKDLTPSQTGNLD